MEWGESPRESVTVKPPGEDKSDTRQPDGFSAETGTTLPRPRFRGHGQVRSAVSAAGRFFHVFPPPFLCADDSYLGIFSLNT